MRLTKNFVFITLVLNITLGATIHQYKFTDNCSKYCYCYYSYSHYFDHEVNVKVSNSHI